MNSTRMFLSAALALVTMWTAGMAYSQDVSAKAQELFDAKKYDECVKLLEPELKKPDVSIPLIRLAINANLRMGNPMSASIVVAELLRRSGKNDMDALFEAAQAAELSGEEKLAASRYHTYAMTMKDRKGVDSRMFKALSFVLANSSSPDAFQCFAEKVGPENTWSGAQNYFERALNSGDGPAQIEMTAFLLRMYRQNPDVIEPKLRDLANNGNLQKGLAGRYLDVLTSAKYPEKDFDFGMLNNLICKFYNLGDLDAARRFRYGRNFIENSGLLPISPDVFAQPVSQAIAKASGADTKERYAKDVIALMPIAMKSKSSPALSLYLNIIKDNRDVFRKVTNPEDLGKLFAAYLKVTKTKYDEWPGAGFLYEYINNYYKDSKEDGIAFAKAALMELTPEMASWLFTADPAAAKTGKKGSLIEKYLSDKDSFESRIREIQILQAIAATESTSRMDSAVRNTILTSSYDPNWMADRIRQSKIPANELAKALAGAGEMAGNDARFTALIDKLLSSPEYKANANLTPLKNLRKNGSEPLYAAAANVYAQKDTAGVVNAMNAFVKTLGKTNVPATMGQARNLKEYTAYQVLQFCKQKLWNDTEGAKALVRAFVPQMSIPGRSMNDLMQKAWTLDGQKNRRGGLYYEMLKYAIPAVAANPGSDTYTWELNNNNVIPANTDIAILAPVYGGSNMEYTAISQLRLSQDSWSKDFFFKQVTALVENPKSNISDSMMYNLSSFLTNSQCKYRNEIPASVVEAMLTKTVARSAKTGKINNNLEMNILRMTKADNLPSMLVKYAELIKNRSNRDRLASICAVYDSIDNGMTRPAGLAFSKAALEPLLNSWAQKDWHQVVLSFRTLNFFYQIQISKDEKIQMAEKQAAAPMYRLLRDSILRGNAIMSTWDTAAYAELLLPGLTNIVKEGNNTSINRAAVMIGSALDRENNTWRGKNVATNALEILKDTPSQLQYVFLNCFTQGTTSFNQECKQQFTMKMSKLAKDIPGLVPVDKNDPAYQLFLAQQMKREGSALEAWANVREKYAILTQRWKEFDLDFVMWCVDMGRKSKMFKEALNLAQTMWLDEAKLSAVDAAKLGVTKGDVYRDMKNFPAAKIEYESLTNNNRYSKTEPGRIAKFRLIELLILTEDYSTARTILERLQEARSLKDQAEAYYLQARIDYETEDYPGAMEKLKEVFTRNNSHEDGHLLEGMIILKEKKFTKIVLDIGEQRLAKIAIPGKPLDLVIQDMNLSVIRGGKALPVIVTTTSGKDHELVELMPNPQDPSKFTAQLQTVLGKPVPNNLVLELNGDDEIEYQIDPKFQEANGIVREPHRLYLRYPAKLYASSKPIAEEGDQELDDLLKTLELTTRNFNGAAYNKTVRPGSPIYLRVVDYAQSKNTNKSNSVFVDVACSSGDELRHFELKETGDCTGVFEGVIQTGIPFPNVTVSDGVEGMDVNAVINSTKTGSWKSLPDAKRPKWLEIDTMTSYNFRDAAITMPNPGTVRNLRVLGILDKDGEELATFPAADKSKSRGGVRVKTYFGRVNPSMQNLQNLMSKVSGEGSYQRTTSFFRERQGNFRNRDEWVCYEMSGVFYLDQNEEIEFKFMQKPDDNQTAFLMVDDRLVFGGKMNAAGIMTRRTLFLQKGIHSLKVYALDLAKNSSIQLGMLQQDGAYQALPAEWFSPEKNVMLAEYLKPKGKITQTQTGFRLLLNKPGRYRKLRWIFEDYTGSQIEVSNATLNDADGKAVIPVTQDLSSGKNNTILEIAAADTITVKYEDEKRVVDNKAVLTDKLSSSFCDADISFNYEETKLDDEGRPIITLSKAMRAARGDDVIVRVTDADADQSEDRETVKVEVITSSGEKIQLELLEEGDKGKGSRGCFRESFRAGDKSDSAKRMLKIQPGDKITARYLDQENNKPGIPVFRTAEIVSNEGSRAQLVVFDVSVKKVEDKSPSALAKIQMLKNKGDKRKEIKLYKDVYDAKPIVSKEDSAPRKKGEAAPEEILVINSKAPLLFELVCPELAKHSASVAQVEVLTKTEQDAAESERREPNPLRVTMPLMPLSTRAGSKGYTTSVVGRDRMSAKEVLEQGVFAGVVRLQLGSANDEINDLVSTNDSFNLLSQDNLATDNEAFKVPTVIVSGSDRITITFKDATGKELTHKTVQLRSDGELELYDKAYLTPSSAVHLGQHFYVRVYDPDRDISADRDSVDVDVVSRTGDKISLKLSETLVHSGVFTGSVRVELKGKPLPGESVAKKLDNATLWSQFGDTVTFTYSDLVPLHSADEQKITKEGTVVIGSDGELAAFTKRFKDPEMAVKTNFLMAEALFEMAKSHKAIKGSDGKPDAEKKELAMKEIAKGRRVLEEALRDYPNTKLKAQGEFLLANLSEQLEDYTKALSQFSTVISKYPDSEYAPKSYFQKAVCYERLALLEKDAQRKKQKGEMACEEYVRLTYLYPDSALASDAKLRLGNYYYKTKHYRLAASVLEKFAEAHPDHATAPQALLLAGFAAYQNEVAKTEQAKAIGRLYKTDNTAAIRIFSTLEAKYPDRKNERSQALFWAGKSLYDMDSHESKVKAYQFFQRLIWDYPETKWAKMARGIMAANPIKNTR